MLEHKQPGKSTLTGHPPHAHGHAHGPGPGKKTLVEQHDPGHGHEQGGHGHGGGALASAASFDGGGPALGTSTSASITIPDGPVSADLTVSLAMVKGKGPVSLNLGKGGAMSVGNDHMSFDLTSAAAKGTRLGLTGASATVVKDGTHNSQVTVKGGGLVSVTYSTTYTVSAHGRTASLTVTATASGRPKPPERHGISKIYHAVTNALAHAGHIAASALKDIVHADVNFVHSSQDWGPALVKSIAEAAAAGDTIVIAV